MHTDEPRATKQNRRTNEATKKPSNNLK